MQEARDTVQHLKGFFYVPLVLSRVVPYLTHRIWGHSELHIASFVLLRILHAQEKNLLVT